MIEKALQTIALKFADRAEPTVIVLTIVIALLAWLLVKQQSRADKLINELSYNSQTLSRLTELLNRLVYSGKDK